MRRLIRAMTALARDSRIPKPLRWLAGIALLPIPGPVDEIVLVLIAPVFFLLYRRPLREAWTGAREGAADANPAARIPSRAPARPGSN